ncbi:MAG: 4Fe-4S binding protein [Candidatus Krumholzibacteriota bacterium]|nr:4Fe-4S binding protein [Candidatus Krumholzibacteriota bacterium]
MKNARRLSQILFLALFLFLFIQTEYKGSNELGLPVRFFLDFDPLIALSVLLATHAARALFLFSIVTVVVSVLFGRVFCGWVCPLGTLNTFAGWFKMRSMKPGEDDTVFRRWRPVKYYVLFFLLVAAAFGWNAAGFVDPISMTIRSLAVGWNPAVNKIVRSFFEFTYAADLPWVSPGLDAVYSAMIGTALAFEQPVFRQSILIGLLFAGVIGLNALAPRFWCRYLCPLGALLGLLGWKQALARVDVDGGKCVSCRRCNLSCQGDATPFPAGRWASRECLACWNCADVCPVQAVSIHPTTRATGDGNVDLTRRWLLASGLGALVAVPAMSVGAHRTRPNPELIRPPGALPEQAFVRTCVKCGECMKVCLTNGLQPTLGQAGLEGLWTPLLVPRLGYCEYNCNLCSQVCPTGAIRAIDLKEKHRIRIGLATIDRDRCIPWALGVNCIVCEEHCPVPGKAIRFEEEERENRRGETFTLKRPVVNPRLCVGCGICENKCPVVDLPAIRVSSINETRSEENRLVL